jgi:hypothetical protein
MTIWYFNGKLVYLWAFGKLFLALVCCAEKNLATLLHRERNREGLT